MATCSNSKTTPVDVREVLHVRRIMARDEADPNLAVVETSPDRWTWVRLNVNLGRVRLRRWPRPVGLVPAMGTVGFAADGTLGLFCQMGGHRA